ncbi:MAG: DUF456 domain-containing protein [Deltaproteobacteria bacterium]|nr:DUF456 domain-containing protein [Deltaproteobacteria bacterium]
MEYVVFFIFLSVMLIGLISLLFGFPGNFLILADCLLYGWYGGFEEIKIKIVIVLIVLAVMGEIFEFVLGVIGSKKHKSSTKAIVGSIVGGILGAASGAPFLFGIGSLIGAFTGAFSGAFIVEYVRIRDIHQAMHSGWGAFIGRVGGTITKGIIGITMISIAVFSVIGR